MGKPDPKFSAGARLEREAFRRYLRRRLQAEHDNPMLQAALAWVLDRKKRYDQQRRGLGK